MSRTSWLIAFSDLAAVLGAFFVMLLAISEYDAPKLDRLALVLGSNDGQWQTVAPDPGSAALAMRRAPVEADAESDYLATVLAERLARAGWPWKVVRLARGVALQQPIGDAAAAAPADMIQYLRSAGYPLRVAVILPASQGRRAGVLGVFDDGLRQAGGLAALLQRGGVDAAIPVETRFSPGETPAALQIILDVAPENRG
jgi:hypothetical protein